MNNRIYYPHISKRKAYVALASKKNITENSENMQAETTEHKKDKPEEKIKKTGKGALKSSLLTLTIGGFAIGMTEFMMMGVLPDVATSLSVSIPTAGHLISIYALGVVIGAPLMVGLASSYPPRKVLIGLMILFGLFNGLFAIAPNYEMLLITRLFSGLPHGAFFGMGAVVASRLAEPGREARAVSVMFAGLTLANIIGVPLGTYIGHNMDWRISFMLIAAIGFIAAISIRRWMPSLAANGTTGFKNNLQVFRKQELWIIIAISAIGTGGLFAWISYIAPMMTEVAGFGDDKITYIMIVAGLGMAAGNFLGGRLADRYSPLRTTSMLLMLMVLSLIIVATVTQWQVPAIIMTFVTGALAFAVIAPMQMLIINAAKGSEMMASASLQASANTGNALGAYLGGLPLVAGYGYTSPQYVGAALAFAGFLLCLVLANKYRQSGKPAIALQTN
ncbi:MFS transporter [Flavihumibacter sp. ZG627]|uniref:MFS transporter n=1 Tax=Flavihumibacter sp. ZG627 TaxID=1463156 RepID=UPI000B16FC07|nr:MFS transporter [Flavihumibacter sp. ZG627]